MLPICYIGIIKPVLWIILLLTGINISAYYVYALFNGPFDSETLKYALYLVIGSYFALILDKSKIDKVLGIKNLKPIKRRIKK